MLTSSAAHFEETTEIMQADSSGEPHPFSDQAWQRERRNDRLPRRDSTARSERFLLLSAIAGNALRYTPYGDDHNRGGKTCSVMWSAAVQTGVPSIAEDDGKENNKNVGRTPEIGPKRGPADRDRRAPVSQRAHDSKGDVDTLLTISGENVDGYRFQRWSSPAPRQGAQRQTANSGFNGGTVDETGGRDASISAPASTGSSTIAPIAGA